MTIEQIQDHIASAADDTFAPASQVSGVEVYRAGLRRRRTRRWLSATVATAVAVVVAGGAAAVVRTAEPVPVSPGGPGADKTSPTPAFRLVWPYGGPPGPVARSCTEFATMVMKSIAGALPPEITWSGPELPEVPTGSSCESGGIFWVRFTLQGQSRRIGFEGGVEMSGTRGCDPARHPVRCDTFPGGEV